MPRVLGVDLGSRRIGLALSDAGGTVASPLAVLERGAVPADDHEAIAGVAREHDVKTIVVGLPLTLEGEVGTAARRVLAEVDHLRRRVGDDLVVEVHDERLSTAEAERAMVGGGVRRERRRGSRDKVAAALILQSWLDRRGRA